MSNPFENQIIKVMETVQEALEPVADKAFFAGGVLRDLLNGKAEHVNDIDVYIWAPFGTPESQINTAMSGLHDHLHIQHGWLVVDCVKSTYESSEIKRVTTYKIPTSPIPVQIIVYATPVFNPLSYVSESFDIGLCKLVQMMDSGRLLTSPEYEKDMYYKTLTVYPDCLSDIQAVKTLRSRLPKLQRKYPNHRIVVQDSTDIDTEVPF